MITLTETAAKKISDLRLEEGKPEWGLRIRVVGGGCSGMSYELGWDDTATDDDNVVETHGVKVFVDSQQRAVSPGQRDRLRRQQHAGRRVRDQEPEREVVLRLRLVPPVLDRRAGTEARSMKVQVRLFARYREAAGRDHARSRASRRRHRRAAWEAVARQLPGPRAVPPVHPVRPPQRLRRRRSTARGRGRALPLPAGERRRAGRRRTGSRSPPSRCPSARSPRRSSTRGPARSRSSRASCATRPAAAG